MFGFNFETLLLIFVIETVMSLSLYVLVRRRVKQRATSIKPPF